MGEKKKARLNKLGSNASFEHVASKGDDARAETGELNNQNPFKFFRIRK